MTHTALTGAFRAAAVLQEQIHHWWDERLFALYYHLFLEDPVPSHKLARRVIDDGRHTILDTVSGLSVAGDITSPTTLDIAHETVQSSVNMAGRINLTSPWGLAAAGLALLAVTEMVVYGGSHTAQIWAGLKSETGRFMEHMAQHHGKVGPGLYM